MMRFKCMHYTQSYEGNTKMQVYHLLTCKKGWMQLLCNKITYKKIHQLVFFLKKQMYKTAFSPKGLYTLHI